MNYINVETLEVLIHLLFKKKADNELLNNKLLHISTGNLDEGDNDLLLLNSKLHNDLVKNNINHLFDFLYDVKNKEKNSFAVFIKIPNKEKEEKLRNFLQVYIDNFKNDKLEGNYYRFSRQIEYLENILKSYDDHFKGCFPINSDPSNNKVPDIDIPDGIRVSEFILFLYFHNYITINNCEYIHSTTRCFSIDIEIELLKPIDKIFEELRNEFNISTKDLQTLTQSERVDLKLLLTKEEINAIIAVKKSKNQIEAANSLCKSPGTLVKQLESAREKVKKALNRDKFTTNELCNMFQE